MRFIGTLALALGLGVALTGCGRGKPFNGPTVDAFTGRLVQNGKPVSFPGGPVKLRLFHEKGESFGIPIQPDGSFQIGWMPIGKYSAVVIREPKNAKAGPSQYTVPGGLTVEGGKTEYTVELGKGWKS